MEMNDITQYSYCVVIYILNNNIKIKLFAKSIEDCEAIIKNKIILPEYQIMNIYKANE